MNESHIGLNIMKNTTDSKNKEYDLLIECILSGQVSDAQVQSHFAEDPKFKEYYITQRRLQVKQ